MLKEKETKISFKNHHKNDHKNDLQKDNMIRPHQLHIILFILIHSKNGICLIKYHPNDPEKTKTNTITTILSQIGNTPTVYLSNKSIKGRKYRDIKPWIIGKEIIIVNNVNNESASNVRQIAKYVSKNNRMLIILTKDHTLELFDPLSDIPVINFVIKK